MVRAFRGPFWHAVSEEKNEAAINHRTPNLFHGGGFSLVRAFPLKYHAGMPVPVLDGPTGPVFCRLSARGEAFADANHAD